MARGPPLPAAAVEGRRRWKRRAGRAFPSRPSHAASSRAASRLTRFRPTTASQAFRLDRWPAVTSAANGETLGLQRAPDLGWAHSVRRFAQRKNVPFSPRNRFTRPSGRVYNGHARQGRARLVTPRLGGIQIARVTRSNQPSFSSAARRGRRRLSGVASSFCVQSIVVLATSQ